MNISEEGTKVERRAYTDSEAEGGVDDMCSLHWRRLVGISAICFGAGILVSFFLPWFFLALIEAAALVLAGVLLLGGRH